MSTAGRGTTAVVTSSRSSARKTTAHMHVTFRLPPIYLLYRAAMISQQLELLPVLNLEHTHTSAWLSKQFPDRHAHAC